VVSSLLWASNTAGRGRAPYQLKVLEWKASLVDCNGNVVWCPGGDKGPVASLTTLHADPVCLTSAAGGPSTLQPPGEYTRLEVTGAGLAYSDSSGTVYWSAPEPGTAPALAPLRLCLGGDGSPRLLDASGAALWSAGSEGLGSPPFTLTIQGGSLVLVDSAGQVLWSAPMQCGGGLRLGAWDQCGGLSCGGVRAALGLEGPCADAQFPGACCPAGWQCARKDQWYRQCRPSALLDSCDGSAVVPVGTQCGGMTKCGRDGVCGDCCVGGAYCLRYNQWSWVCSSMTEFRGGLLAARPAASGGPVGYLYINQTNRAAAARQAVQGGDVPEELLPEAAADAQAPALPPPTRPKPPPPRPPPPRPPPGPPPPRRVPPLPRPPPPVPLKRRRPSPPLPVLPPPPSKLAKKAAQLPPPPPPLVKGQLSVNASAVAGKAAVGGAKQPPPPLPPPPRPRPPPMGPPPQPLFRTRPPPQKQKQQQQQQQATARPPGGGGGGGGGGGAAATATANGNASSTLTGQPAAALLAASITAAAKRLPPPAMRSTTPPPSGSGAASSGPSSSKPAIYTLVNGVVTKVVPP
jgi:hypothetical protein